MSKSPKRKTRDIAHALVKAGISKIPILGAPASELFSLIITPSIEKRRLKWIESIAESFEQLEEKFDAFDFENLRENESFVSMVMQASQAAIRTHQKQKLESLRNAVLNTALPNAPEENLQFMFLNFVDSLTWSHLRVLKLLNDYKAKRPSNRYTGKRIELVAMSKEIPLITLEKALPDLGENQNFYDQVLKDLRMRGLLEIGMGEQTHFLEKLPYAKPTNLGKQLLAFIGSPFIVHSKAEKVGKSKAEESK